MQRETHPAILGLGTAVPRHQVEQIELCDWMSEALVAEPALGRWLRSLYKASGIATRHSVLSDAERSPGESQFAPGRAPDDVPTTGDRMAIYARESVPLGTQAARQALDSAARSLEEPVHALSESVTHVIAVSCTGFFAPGLDLAIARQLGLQPSVERTLVGFMGCAAAFNALRLAAQIVQGRPEARVLIVCIELCSIHVQPGRDRINLTVGALFADGAAACLVGAAPVGTPGSFTINGLHTYTIPDTESEMTWRIGNHGFVMHLSPQIPQLLRQAAPEGLEGLLRGKEQPDFWAIHPGGPSIVDQVVDLLGLTPEQAAPSRAVLRRYGNMSSPTILFVLRELHEQMRDQPEARSGVAMAFGPGLVAEMAHLTYHPQRTRRPAASTDGEGALLAWLA